MTRSRMIGLIDWLTKKMEHNEQFLKKEKKTNEKRQVDLLCNKNRTDQTRPKYSLIS